MTWNQDDGPPPRGYHHGNLKETLIRAALDLIARKGPSGVTFAEAARFAGVSPAAPYRHFRDRDELLANVALRGFILFEATLTRAWNDGQPDAFAAFERMGRAYLEFARTEPPIIPPCSRLQFRLISIRSCGKRGIAPSRRFARPPND